MESGKTATVVRYINPWPQVRRAITEEIRWQSSAFMNWVFETHKDSC